MLLKRVVSLTKMDGFRANFEFVKPIRELFMPENRNEEREILNKYDFKKIQNAVLRIRPNQVHDIQQEFVRQNKELTRDQLIQLCEDAVKVKSVAIFSFFFTDVLFINSDGTRNQQMEQNILKCALKSSCECFHFLISMGLELKMDTATIFRTLISSKSPENLKYFCDQSDFGLEAMVVHGFLFNIFRRGVEENIKVLLEYEAVRKQINELIEFKSDNWSGALNQYAPLHCCLLSFNHTVWTGPRDKQLKLRCLEMIVNAGADINLCSIMEKQSVAPILMAAKNQHEDLVWYFLQHGVDFHTDPEVLDKVIEELQYEYLQNLKESQERRPKKSYVHQFRTPDITVQLKCLERLYQLKGVPYSRDSPAHISLYLTAAPSNDLAFMTLLDQAIKNGLNFKMSHLPVLVKVMESLSYDATLIKKLLDIGCNVHLSLQGKTPLLLAAQNLKKDVMCLLLEHGADVNAKTVWRNAGYSCLAHYYNRSENSVKRTEDRLEILDILIGAGLDYKNPETGLFSAAFQSKTYDKQCIWYLINKGLDVNNVYSCGKCQNILHLAAEWVYDEEFLTELLTTGVDMEQMGDGDTPLTLAAMMRNPCLTKVLVDNGCDINRRCADGETALRIAISRSYTESLVRILLEGGADIENYMRDSDLASLLEYNQIFFYLILKHGGDMYLNHRDSKGFRLIQRLLKPDCEVSDDGIPDETLLYRLIAYNCSLDDLQIPKDDDDSFSYRYHTESYGPGLFCDSEFSSKFKRIFYLSGAPKKMLRHLPQFEFYDDDCCYSDEDDDNEDGEKDGESSVFNLEKMCFEQNLKSLCRRIVRQSMGLGIKTKLEKSFLPRSIQSYILLKDEIPEEYFEIPEEKIVEKLS